MIFIFVGLISFYTVNGLPFDGRIVNGTDAKEGEFPYIISLQHEVIKHICGGSILNKNWILTAAHCVDDISDPKVLSVQYGLTKSTHNEQYNIPVELVISHPDYAPDNGYLNDIAVIKLSNSLNFSRTVQSVKLAPANNATPEGADSVAAGWGFPSTIGSTMEDLQRVNIKVYSDEDCERSYPKHADSKYHICAGVPEGGKGTCYGDSGGPLVVNEVQVGIVSWSYYLCASQGYPTVFAKVSSYVDWINAQLSEDS